MDKNPLIFVIISATLFGLSVPLAKLIVVDISPVALAGLLYIGAFVGLSLYALIRKKPKVYQKTASLEKKDLPWLFGAIITGGILGPISLMTGLTLISGFSASLLLNMEGLATVLIAVLVFKENTGKRLWISLTCMTLAGVLLTWNPTQNKFTITVRC